MTVHSVSVKLQPFKARVLNAHLEANSTADLFTHHSLKVGSKD